MIPLLRRFASILLLALVPACLHAQDSVHGDDGGEDSLGVALADTTAADSIEALGEPAWPGNVAGRIDRLLGNELFNRSQVGLMVYDLTADSAIYCHNAGAIEDGVLNGDVYLVGGFDPRFNSDDMGSFVDGIRRMGIDTIRGRIVADKSMKDADMLGEGWCWDDDNPVLSPLLISRRDVFVKRFVDRLRDEGVVVEADTVAGRQPGGAYEVGTRTHTIDQVLMPMMKESDNLCAEALFYQLGASTGAHPATARDARTVVRRLVEKVGLRPSDYRIADGSGLSLYNYVTAELEVMLLRYAYQNTNIYMHLLPSLPVAGEDGTLRRRMRGTFTSGNVKAKTGSVTAISSLAGYCTAANGHVLCFAIINQGIRRGSEGRAFQDRVCEALCRP